MNRFMDKHPKTQRLLRSLTGDSILFNPSNELWSQKRKHLSAAFYKDKLNPMLEMIIKTTNLYIRKLLQEQSGPGKTMDILKFGGDLINSTILLCVFGVKIENIAKLKYMEGGKEELLDPGMFLKKIFTRQIMRGSRFFRILFDWFDLSVVGEVERYTKTNGETFRGFIQGMIAQRRLEMTDGQKRADFLSMMLEDELFQGQEELIVDECITFMLAATQTSTNLVTNAMYFLSKHTEVREKLRKEMRRHVGEGSLQGLSDDKWIEILLEKELVTECNYLSYCVTETLRLCPPVRLSSRLIATDKITLSNGFTILEGQDFIVNMFYL